MTKHYLDAINSSIEELLAVPDIGRYRKTSYLVEHAVVGKFNLLNMSFMAHSTES